MVDIIKSFPHTATGFSYNTRRLQSKGFHPQILPSISPTKRWIGNRPLNPSPLIDVSKSPYAIHRKVMYQQLSRNYPTTVDAVKSSTSKQQRGASKETTKTSSTTTTTGNSGPYMIPQATVAYGDTHSTRLFDTLSKHVTVKPEPIRPSNGLINNPSNALTSWQRYWTSTHTQRRRREAGDLEPALYRPKREQTLPGQTHFVVIRDSPFPLDGLRPYDGETPAPSDINAPTTEYNFTPHKPILSTKEDEIKKVPAPISTIQFVASALIPASNEMNFTAASKISTAMSLKSLDKEDEKTPTDKCLFLSSSSNLKTDSQLIEEVSQAQLDPRLVTTKVFKLSVPIDQSKKNKKSQTRKIIHSKSPDKRETQASSASKRKRQESISKRSMNKSELSTIMAATSISKYSQRRWDEPYVGHRLDPPTPPCSPSLFIWLHDSDEDDDEIAYEKSEIYEIDLPD